jgi:hypothetical protein
MGTVEALRPAVRFPVTLVLGLQYLALAVLPAVINGNPYLPFILSIVAVGLLTAVLAEWLYGTVTRRDDGTKAIRYPGAIGVWVVTVTGAVALLAGAWLGARTYATQVGATSASPLTTLLTPLQPWLLIGCAFALASWRAGIMGRRAMIVLIAVALTAQLISGLWLAILAPVMNFALTLGIALVLVGFVRPRWLLVGFAAAILVWPVLYAARNATRGQVLGSAPQSTLDASSRLREDLLLQLAAVFGDSVKLPQPSAVDILRFGLIPRALDPERGSLPSGTTLSVALGSASTSSSTFTVLGTIWSLDGGYLGVIVYVACVALAFSLICMRLTPVRLAFAMLLVSDLLWIEATYPDNLAAVLQGLLSLAFAWVLLVGLGALKKGGTPTIMGLRSTASPAIETS